MFCFDFLQDHILRSNSSNGLEEAVRAIYNEIVRSFGQSSSVLEQVKEAAESERKEKEVSKQAAILTAFIIMVSGSNLNWYHFNKIWWNCEWDKSFSCDDLSIIVNLFLLYFLFYFKFLKLKS